MKISKIPQINNDINRAENNNDLNKVSLEQKQADKSALDVQANYNMAFKGLGDIFAYDCTNINIPCKMVPNKKYKVAENACFKLDDTTVDLASKNYNSLIKNMQAGDTYIFGRNDGKNNSIEPENCTNHVSREHLKIHKNMKGDLIAVDLNSMNGTTIVYSKKVPKKWEDFSRIDESKYLEPHKKTVVPSDSQLYLGNNLTIDMRNKNILAELNNKGKITIGRGEWNDFVVPEFYGMVSRNHIAIEMTDYGITATENGSLNGTLVVPKNKIDPFMNGVSDIDISQANVGDCYLLSSIYALSLNPIGQKILKDMVKVDDYGNYIVYFPHEEPYIIKPEELDGQTKSDGSKKRSVSGDLGIKAIERAYGKMVKYQNAHYFDPNMSFKTMFMAIDDGGRPENALERISGYKANVHPTKDINDPDSFFRRYSEKNRFIIGCETPNRAYYGDCVDPQHLFPKNHAYTVKNIDTKNRMVEVVNPHNTRKSNWVSYEDFLKYFHVLTIAYVC